MTETNATTYSGRCWNRRKSIQSARCFGHVQWIAAASAGHHERSDQVIFDDLHICNSNVPL
jgi:hypothetical protein